MQSYRVVLFDVRHTVLHAVLLIQAVVLAAVDDRVSYAANDYILALAVEGVSDVVVCKVTEDVIHRTVSLTDIAIIENYFHI